MKKQEYKTTVIIGKTPPELYNTLNNEFKFDFDPCPLNHNLNLWDGLEIEWGKSNFINPPYSRKLKKTSFCKKSYCRK